MTYLFNDPAQFADELIEGYVAAYSDHVSLVDGGVICCHQPKPGQVVVVIGGGSGHYPAFGGFVGQGLAHGAAMGNVFASPSAQQIINVANAIDAGGGILFCCANYAGDVMNFGQARERLRADGIAVEMIVVTDDIASAPINEKHKRRGIAGTFTVFKAAAVAADSGKSLDEVMRVAVAANERVRTLGVAFSGCTLPGASQPLFEVAQGKMEIGMGIHGETGFDRMDTPTADGLAELLVNRLLEEIPSNIETTDGAHVGVILNGLGSVKYEELFVIYRQVSQLLSKHQLTIVAPIVDELITSFDMAGVSLTLFWLNEELELTWLAAVNTPAFRRAYIAPSNTEKPRAIKASKDDRFDVGSLESQAAARVIFSALQTALTVIEEQQNELGRLDAIAGDGDHGIGMYRGLSAAVSAAQKVLEKNAGAGTLLAMAGDAWATRAGGTSGALWGVILRNLGNRVGDQATPDVASIASGIAEALNEVTHIGKAMVGDKTLVDVLHPFSETLTVSASQKLSISAAWNRAAEVANIAAQATKKLTPKIGRARPHAEKSVGTIDPGAMSMALIIRAVANILNDNDC